MDWNRLWESDKGGLIIDPEFEVETFENDYQLLSRMVVSFRNYMFMDVPILDDETFVAVLSQGRFQTSKFVYYAMWKRHNIPPKRYHFMGIDTKELTLWTLKVFGIDYVYVNWKLLN